MLHVKMRVINAQCTLFDCDLVFLTEVNSWFLTSSIRRAVSYGSENKRPGQTCVRLLVENITVARISAVANLGSLVYN